jgi:hypothetical protein
MSVRKREWTTRNGADPGRDPAHRRAPERPVAPSPTRHGDGLFPPIMSHVCRVDSPGVVGNR